MSPLVPEIKTNTKIEMAMLPGWMDWIMGVGGMLIVVPHLKKDPGEWPVLHRSNKIFIEPVHAASGEGLQWLMTQDQNVGDVPCAVVIVYYLCPTSGST
jgi:hypothetical protein